MGTLRARIIYPRRRGAIFNSAIMSIVCVKAGDTST